MLTIILPQTETHPEAKLTLEHSLVSLSKWESIHEKPFFGREEKTDDEMRNYIRLMLLTDNPPENFSERLGNEQLIEVFNYINSKQTATTFRDMGPEKPSAETTTTDLIYYWMIQFQIPFQPAETWHFNRLMTLIKICGIKQTKPKKMSKSEQIAEMRALNEKRRRELGTSG